MGYYAFGCGSIYLTRNNPKGYEAVANTLGITSSCMRDVLHAIVEEANIHK